MSNSGPTQPLPPANWYPDPQGSGGLRWWDGTQWTQHVAPAGGAAQAPAYGQHQNAQTHYAQPRRLPADVPVDTVPFWILAFLPLAILVPLLLWDIAGYAREIAQSTSGSIYSPFAMYTDPGYLSLLFVGLAVNVATIVLAYFDWRTLERRGVDRPFHWAWSLFALLNSGVLVYMIGRSVVVRRRSGRGLTPLWVFVAVEVFCIIVASVVAINLVTEIIATIPFDELSTSTNSPAI